MSATEYPVTDEHGTMLGLICDDWDEIPFCPAVGYSVSANGRSIEVDLEWHSGVLVTTASVEELQWIEGFRPEDPNA